MMPAASSSSPIILMAAPRSCAHLLQRALAAHPVIAFAAPFDFLVDAIRPNGRFMKAEAFARAVEHSGAVDRLGLIVPRGLGFAGIAQHLLGQVAAKKPAAHIVGITLQRGADRALWLWPDARFIHFVRDGRDVAAAEVAAGWSGNLWHGIAHWVATEQLWERMANKLPPDRQISISFEMLRAEPENQLRRICAYLGLAFDPVMLKTFENPLPSGGRWRKAPAAELSAAEYAAARGLLQNGYLLSGTVRPPGAFRRILLRANRRAAIAAKRRELLGFRGWLRIAARGLFQSHEPRERRIRHESELFERDWDWA